MEQVDTVEAEVRDFLVATFWMEPAFAEAMTDDSDLVDGGVLDSMNVLQLVDFLEERFDFMLDPEELFRLTTVANIAALVREKLA
ncbi:MAG TPA: acyl carrier protein [Acidimicrobiales bacterium]|jgi:acyl carrier protein